MFNIFCTWTKRKAASNKDAYSWQCLRRCLTRRGGATALLDGRTSKEKKQMAEAWDLCQHTPVGVIFNRPDFENQNEVNNADNGTRESNKKRFTEYSDGRNKRV